MGTHLRVRSGSYPMEGLSINFIQYHLTFEHSEHYIDIFEQCMTCIWNKKNIAKWMILNDSIFNIIFDIMNNRIMMIVLY